MTDIYPDVVSRLGSFDLGLNISDNAVRISIEQARTYISTNINNPTIPDELRVVFIDMACGLYLRNMKTFGRLDPNKLNLEATAKTIKEGDVQITFSGASDGTLTPEARLDLLINSMINPPEGVFSRFRRLIW